MSKSTIKSVKFMVVVKLMALAAAFVIAPKLMTLTFFCFFGIGKTLGQELRAGMQRFGWTLFTFAFMCGAGCLVQSVFPNLGYTAWDMVVISAAWLFVFGIPLDACDIPTKSDDRRNTSTTAMTKKEPVILNAEVVE